MIYHVCMIYYFYDISFHVIGINNNHITFMIVIIVKHATNMPLKKKNTASANDSRLQSHTSLQKQHADLMKAHKERASVNRSIGAM